jgi:hypothetical protein
MAEFILTALMGRKCPSDLHTVHHMDGDSLNNTRDNLRWATKAEQSSEQKPRMGHSVRKAIDQARIAA